MEKYIKNESVEDYSKNTKQVYWGLKQIFKQLGMLLYGIDGIYDEYGRKNKIASTNVL